MNRIFKVACLITALLFASDLRAQVKKKVEKKTVITKKKSTSPAVKPVVAEVFTHVKITTTLGNIIIRLYNKTPLHRDNFIKLVNTHFYDSLLFHRVINQFMIQGGDPKSKMAAVGEMLGIGSAGYTIPAEFDSTLFHKKGALCAARTENPEKASSGCQFYIVQGKKCSDGELDNIENQSGFKFSPAKRMTYKMNGGAPMLDMNYTVFGEVETGMDILDLIAAVPGDNRNRPFTDIRMKMEILQQETEKTESKK